MARTKPVGTLFAQPLGTSKRLALVQRTMTFPPGAELLAEIDNSGRGTNDDNYGWLIRLASGTIVIKQVTGSIKSVDPRVAEVALNAVRTKLRWHPLPTDDADQMDVEGGEDIDLPAPDPRAEAEALATRLKAFRANGNLPLSRLAQILGMSKRTLENIEQGRGFSHSRLLLLALAALE